MTPHPFTGRTPEALVGRNDSKNPATTCRGITNSGRPCRRALARKSGVVAIVEGDEGTVEEASYYCHDHKAQAGNAGSSATVQSAGRTKTELYTLNSRNSVDTLVQRLGVEGVGSEISTKVRRKKHEGRHRLENRQDAPYAENYGLGQGEGRHNKKEKSSFWSTLCCGGGGEHDEDDYVEIVRHKKRLQDSRPTNTSSRPSAPAQKPPPSPGRPTRPTTALPLRPAANHASSNSQAGNLLSLIPPTLPPTTASALLAELSKPPNPNDEEGYIYIFWLTPQQDKTPDTTTARSLLSPETHSRRERRISDVVSEFSYTAEQPRSANPRSNKAKPTILLKIGRANNVTRRMNEWQRQCGYALSLVRWYPYVSSSAAPSPAPSSPARSPRHHGRSSSASASRPDGGRRESSGLVRKVPCVKRVERLIHLELAERRITKNCTVCGREHREWFEVDGTEKGVRGVDETVRRWVAWGESQVQ